MWVCGCVQNSSHHTQLASQISCKGGPTLLIHAGHPTTPDAAQHEEGAGQVQIDV